MTAPAEDPRGGEDLLYPLGRGCCGAPDATACRQRGLCWMEGVHPDSPGCAARPAGDRAQPTPWTPADGDSRCQQCGNPNPVWRAPHRLWNTVVGGDPDREAGGVLCPTCFLALPAVAALLDAQAAVSRVEALAKEYRFAGSALHDVRQADVFAGVAEELRAALDGT